MKSIIRLTAVLLSACAFSSVANANFMLSKSTPLIELGKTSKADIVTVLGEPDVTRNSLVDGEKLEVLHYSYILADAEPAITGTIATREQGFIFKDDVLVGKEYSSSAAADSTLFDLTKVKQVQQGLTQDEVEQIMGKAKSGYLPPLAANDQGYSWVYLADQSQSEQPSSDLLVVEFNHLGVVTATQFSSVKTLD